MDIGKVQNLLVWVNKNHEKPVRVNDHLLSKKEASELIELLKQASSTK
jgi:hypothetical protein